MDGSERSFSQHVRSTSEKKMPFLIEWVAEAAWKMPGIEPQSPGFQPAAQSLYQLSLRELYIINPSKTKRICFIYGLSAYRAVNTLHFGYKKQSLNVL
jgi:hypothetical protein